MSSSAARVGSRRAGWAPRMDATRAERLERAKGYPYARPPSSYVLIRQRPYLFGDTSWPGISGMQSIQLKPMDDDEGRSLSLQEALDAEGMLSAAVDQNWTPVLAIGSNAGHSQLCRKYPADLFPSGVVIPVVKAMLEEFDVCYAPLITSYGSISATLDHCPGTTVELYVTYLDDSTLEHMHRTEGAYDLQRLSGVKLHLGTSLDRHVRGVPPASVLDEVLVYVHQEGTLRLPEESSASPTPVALHEIQAVDRRYPSLTQVQMQAAIRHCLGEQFGEGLGSLALTESRDEEGGGQMAMNELPLLQDSKSLNDWIANNVEDNSARQLHLPRLARLARPFACAQAERLMSLGDMFSKNVK